MDPKKLDFDRIVKVFLLGLIALFIGLLAYGILKPSAGSARGPAGAGGAVPMAGAPAAGKAAGKAAAPGGGAASASGSAAPGGPGDAARAPSGSVSAVTVSAMELQPSTIRTAIRLNGDVVSPSQISVYPDTSGRLVRYQASVGDRVSKGDVLAWIDPSKPGASYAESPVRSPIEGTVISLPLAAGQSVSVSSAIAAVGSLRNLEILTYVPEKYVAVLKTGLPASVTLAPYPGKALQAAVTQVSPVIDPASRTVELTLSAADGEGLLRAGMFAVITLVTRERTGIIAVPNGAIRDYNNEKVVYAVDAAGVARRKAVQTGLANDTETEILSGVSFGDRVIVSGSVSEGTPVRIAGGEASR